jgi:SAM-dependent methyltransferase
MGHALEEIHRVLKPGGCLVDIRPYFPASERNRRQARDQICYVHDGTERPVGSIWRSLAKYRFADRLLADTIRRGMFTLIAHEAFRFRHHVFPAERFGAYLKSEWGESKINVSDRRRIDRLIRLYPQAVMRVEVPVQINVMRKGE